MVVLLLFIDYSPEYDYLMCICDREEEEEEEEKKSNIYTTARRAVLVPPPKVG